MKPETGRKKPTPSQLILGIGLAILTVLILIYGVGTILGSIFHTAKGTESQSSIYYNTTDISKNAINGSVGVGQADGMGQGANQGANQAPANQAPANHTPANQAPPNHTLQTNPEHPNQTPLTLTLKVLQYGLLIGILLCIFAGVRIWFSTKTSSTKQIETSTALSKLVEHTLGTAPNTTQQFELTQIQAYISNQDIEPTEQEQSTIVTILTSKEYAIWPTWKKLIHVEFILSSAPCDVQAILDFGQQTDLDLEQYELIQAYLHHTQQGWAGFERETKSIDSALKILETSLETEPNPEIPTQSIETIERQSNPINQRELSLLAYNNQGLAGTKYLIERLTLEHNIDLKSQTDKSELHSYFDTWNERGKNDETAAPNQAHKTE